MDEHEIKESVMKKLNSKEDPTKIEKQSINNDMTKNDKNYKTSKKLKTLHENLQKAKKAKNDDFYTQLTDIEYQRQFSVRCFPQL